MRPIITKKNATPQPQHGGQESGVVGQAGAANTEVGKADGNIERLRKLVPAEVIAGYTALVAISATVAHESVKYAVPTAIAACVLLIVLALRRAGRKHMPPVEPPRLQYVFSILAFLVWAILVRDPLDPFGYEIPRWITAFGCVRVPLFGSYLIDLTDKEPEN